ncbi:hypothetical protein EDB84DRAFT_625836 [Lactarius hengduanensis]|nr:hypothetical protein EDB84DRAFT_625836 [Lactarius hengduanensis]
MVEVRIICLSPVFHSSLNLRTPRISLPSRMSACFNRRSITLLLPLPSPRQIVLESLLALFLEIIGACVKAPTLEEVTSNEMKTKYRPRTIENMDTRMCFANFVTTGRVLGQDRANRAGQRRGCVRAG